MHEIAEMKQMGLSVSKISEVTAYDCKTVKKYLIGSESIPKHGRQQWPVSKLEPQKRYVEDRLQAGVWNAQSAVKGDSGSVGIRAATRF